MTRKGTSKVDGIIEALRLLKRWVQVKFRRVQEHTTLPWKTVKLLSNVRLSVS